MKTFETIGNFINQFPESINPDIVNTFMTDIRPLASIILSMFIVWRGTELMLGKSNKTAQDTFLEMIVWSVIWAFAFNTGGWLDMTKSGLHEIYNYAGGTTLYTTLDNIYDNLALLGSNLLEADDDYIQIRGSIAYVLVIIGMIILLVPTVVILFLGGAGAQMLIILSPMIILTYLFPTLKSTFYKGVESFLSLFLVTIIISIVFNSLETELIEFSQKALSLSMRNEVDFIGIALTTLIKLLLYASLIIASVPISRGLAGSSSMIGEIGSGFKKSLK